MILSSQAIAQNVERLSLRNCIDFAMKNQPKIKSALLDEQLQLEKNKEEDVKRFSSIVDKLKTEGDCSEGY